MRIVCPSCAALYDVPATALAPGRVVRCARCGTEWPPLPAEAPRPAAPSGADPAIAIPAVPDPGSGAAPATGAGIELMPGRLGDERAGQRPGTLATHPRGAGVAPVAAWIASLAILAALAGAAYAWRAPIMAAWPPSERLYAALGLVHGSGRGP